MFIPQVQLSFTSQDDGVATTALLGGAQFKFHGSGPTYTPTALTGGTIKTATTSSMAALASTTQTLQGVSTAQIQSTRFVYG